jgi:hypothetical protein
MMMLEIGSILVMNCTTLLKLRTERGVERIRRIVLSVCRAARTVRNKASTTEHRPHICIIKGSPSIVDEVRWGSQQHG